MVAQEDIDPEKAAEQPSKRDEDVEMADQELQADGIAEAGIGQGVDVMDCEPSSGTERDIDDLEEGLKELKSHDKDAEDQHEDDDDRE